VKRVRDYGKEGGRISLATLKERKDREREYLSREVQQPEKKSLEFEKQERPRSKKKKGSHLSVLLVFLGGGKRGKTLQKGGGGSIFLLSGYAQGTIFTSTKKEGRGGAVNRGKGIGRERLIFPRGKKERLLEGHYHEEYR